MAKKRSSAAPTAAVRVLIEAGIPHELQRFDAGHDHFGQHAADALEAPAELILKTLVIDHGSGLAVCCIPVTGRLSLKKAAAALGVSKATMADPAKASRSSGYIPGGISPIGQRTSLPTLIDTSVHDAPAVYVSGGRRGLDITLSPTDLATVTGAHFIDLVQ
ncbi:Cys-tRNA(Pro) deacylase [Corynebacterium alimapuense]|uniref:Cys-tRNA(Pro)/Cys-tRNA(Cys) deacylase n=1 Tax=Corynebacterium alimapuense TaxID=1576874 RepID=A0A3M8K740_9CORY|nr:Cys-tRNA(Pro) deacylase [Corynebacterium alimapuense]RNE49041.1 Cys-tRNA(Pro) deacylase [Corynebacterium alimapuense]